MSIQRSRFAGEKILIADDEEVIVNLAGLLLKKYGFEVFSANNGEQCLLMVAEHQPALVLLDYMMPVINGLDALKQIRSQYPDTYVVMFTGKGNEEVAVELMKAGAADYLRKPFVNRSLKDRIDAVLSVRQVEIKNRELLKERELLQSEIQQWNSKLEQRVREKSSQLEQAHKEIIQSEKLATLGHISAGMVHEIRNPLNSINLFAQIVLSAEGLDEENQGYLYQITQEVERIDEILIQLLASSSGNVKKISRVNLADILNKVLDDYQTRIDKQKIELNLNLGCQVPSIQADSLEVEKIFTNLIGNALFEMPAGGILTISLQADAEKLSVTVADTGPGIPHENISRIFDPFFTTKEKGTGFGLSVVLQVVKSCGGKIHVDSSPGAGACFSIELPLFPDSVH
ncbi:MAG: response regulator [Desulfuromusa sp.]|jgi:signal transduction histidine kinase|nr:response regulator [Desulfuromusa sp.]